MKEVIMTPGTHIEYETTSKSITFGDEDLTINLKNRQMDETTKIDICSDKQNSRCGKQRCGYAVVVLLHYIINSELRNLLTKNL